MSEFQYKYEVGKRVGLLARLTDVHDKGAFVMQIEGTEAYVQIPEALLRDGVDLIHAKLQEKAALAAQPEHGERVEVVEKAQKPKREKPAADPHDQVAAPGDESGSQSA